MGDIYKRSGSELWQGSYTDEAGNPKRVSLRTRDEKVAKERLDDLERKAWLIRQGMVEPSPVTVTGKGGAKTLQDAFDRSLKTHYSRDPKKAETRVAEAKIRWKCLVRVMDPKTPLSAIGRMAAEDARASLLALKVPRGDVYYSAATANRMLALLGKLLNLAEGWDWIKAAPTMPKTKEDGRTVTLSDQQIVALWAAIRESGNPKYVNALDLFITLHHEALRLGEAWGPKGLQWSQINLHDGTLTLWEDTTKGSQAVIKPLTKTVLGIMKRRAKMGLAAPFEGISAYMIQTAWRFGVKSLGLGEEESQRIIRHTLRHTTATKLIEQGHSLPVVKQYLGHKAIQTTMKYIHAHHSVLQAAANTLEKCAESVQEKQPENHSFDTVFMTE